MIARHRNAIVIGAGPAGSLAAVLLARAGWAVTLIEQQTFPRDKVCGECLSSLGLAVLERAGLLGQLRELGMMPLRRASVWATSGESIDVTLEAEMGGLSRAAMDTALRDAAVAAGARLLQPARCEGVMPGATPRVRVRDLISNEITEQSADVVLLADGKGGATAGVRRPTNGDLGVKCHLANVEGPADVIELFGLIGHYVGLAAIDGGRWNLAMSVPKAMVRQFAGDFDQLLVSACRENPALAKRLAPASRQSIWHSSPLPRFGVQPVWPAGVIPIGNAAAALEPIGGEGMGLALRSAELAVKYLADATDPAELRREYRTLWRSRRLWCRAAAMATSRPWLASVAIEMVAAERDLATWMAGQMGKGSSTPRITPTPF